MLDFTIDEDQNMLIEAIGRFADGRIRIVYRDADEDPTKLETEADRGPDDLAVTRRRKRSERIRASCRAKPRQEALIRFLCSPPRHSCEPTATSRQELRLIRCDRR